ncbi:MAG: hypothetical protein EA401_05235 [Planctomycetota bacterium]|nr:MAG: hypothetical protein EA401_05235 [Planctomycetota bacterium]
MRQHHDDFMQILLGISGGIAAYKTPEVVRALVAAGHQVRCVLTENAAQLVAPQALVTVSGNPVYDSLWSQDGRIPHIETVRWCDLLLVAPATANLLAKCALGLADDLLSTGFLALEPDKPCIMAPAMNTVMWNKPIVQQHLATLKAQGVHMVDPVSGNLACGEEGIGAMASVDGLVAAVQEHAQ